MKVILLILVLFFFPALVGKTVEFWIETILVIKEWFK